MSDQNKAVVRRLIEDHWNKKNQALVSELFAPNATLETPDGTLNGHEGASFLLRAYAVAFPDFVIRIDDLLADGDRVIARWTFTGTHEGALGDIPASGKRVNVPNAIGIYHLAEAKVVEAHFAWDKYLLLMSLGALPASAPAETAAPV
jgi:predicted ester cyclase